MFVSGPNGWSSLLDTNSAPENTIPMQNWTVGFDGRSFGTIDLRNPSPGTPKRTDWTYARDKLFIPIGTVPRIKGKKGTFGGWCDSPATRPLALVSRPDVRDPAGWKGFTPGPEYRQKLYPALRLVLGRANVENCDNPDENIGKPYLFGANDLKLFHSYRSNTGGELISIGLDSSKYRCDGYSGAEWGSHWFLIRGNEIDYIGTDMELVDAGDYDGDGKSELLFWGGGYNKDGYLLFFNDMRQKVEYTWSYH